MRTNETLQATFVAGVAAAVMGIAVISSPAVKQPLTHQPEFQTAQEYALEYACGAMHDIDYDACMELDPPEVRFAELIDLQGGGGYYWPRRGVEGSFGRIWLDIGLESDVSQSDPRRGLSGYNTLVHETVHYIDVQLGTYTTGCESERKAWGVGNLFLLEHGAWDLAVWDWWDRYAKCERPDPE